MGSSRYYIKIADAVKLISSDGVLRVILFRFKSCLYIVFSLRSQQVSAASGKSLQPIVSSGQIHRLSVFPSFNISPLLKRTNEWEHWVLTCFAASTIPVCNSITFSWYHRKILTSTAFTFFVLQGMSRKGVSHSLYWLHRPPTSRKVRGFHHLFCFYDIHRCHCQSCPVSPYNRYCRQGRM